MFCRVFTTSVFTTIHCLPQFCMGVYATQRGLQLRFVNSSFPQVEQGEAVEEEMVEGAARWKVNMASKAKEGFVQRQLNATNLHSVNIELIPAW